jgi:CRP/FNR family cyclic AMP-dependent transcriptional regulator
MTYPTLAELAAIPLFASFSRKDLEDATRLFTVRTFPKGSIVASEGQQLEAFNVILSGSLQWFFSDDVGHRLRFGIEEPGGHFADSTLFGEPILMSIVALEPLRVATIPLDEFRRMLLRHPRLAVALLGDVVARLRRLVKATRTLTMEEVYGRVVKLLLAGAADFPEGQRLTHMQIGERVGATREMVGRILRDLAKGGYIEMARGRIRILRKPPRGW